MNDTNNWPLLALFIGFAILVFIINHFREKRRTQELSELAQKLGLRFEKSTRQTTQKKLAHFNLFQQGRRRRARNELWVSEQTMEGHKETTTFGYQYTMGSGKHSTTHRQTIFSITHPAFQLPQFEIKPERFYHKIGQVFGYQDIDFPGHPNFSSAYLLRGKDTPAIESLFSPELIRFFEAERDLCVEASGKTFIMYRHAVLCGTNEIEGFINQGKGFADRILHAHMNSRHSTTV